MHGGVLPEYRGVHGNIHAILTNTATTCLRIKGKPFPTGTIVNNTEKIIIEINSKYIAH